MRVVSEMVAGSVADPQLGPRMVGLIEPWIELAQAAAERVLAPSGLAAIVSPRQVAFSAVTFYLGANLQASSFPTAARSRRSCRELRRACGARVALPATRLMLEAGAVLMRTESELVLKSRRVIPGRLLEHGFAFEYPSWPQASRDLCAGAAG
ncbi:MAG: uncharacterized protein QOE31_4000 [Solirubrobacteraceae bacterium]|nr:uncharacterized protein [Solirubrobacteraceae bacterium]